MSMKYFPILRFFKRRSVTEGAVAVKSRKKYDLQYDLNASFIVLIPFIGSAVIKLMKIEKTHINSLI